MAGNMASAVLLCLCCLCFCFCFVVCDSSQSLLHVNTTVIQVLDPRYVSFTIDSHHLSGASAYSFDHPRFIQLVSNLSPAFIRVGGTSADKLFYDMSSNERLLPPGYSASMNSSTWDKLNQMMEITNMSLVFGLNGGPGPRNNSASGVWDPSNAASLIAHAAKSGHSVYAYELSNEINLFPFVFGLPYVAVNGSVLASDFIALRSVLDEMGLNQVKLAGPDVAFILIFGPLFDYMNQFLQAGGGSVVDIITYHWYPTISDHEWPLKPLPNPFACTVDSIRLNSTLDEIDLWIPGLLAMRSNLAPAAALWAGETGGASGGGEANVTDAFVDGFWYLDELGKLAQQMHQAVCRQEIRGENYGLLNADSDSPFSQPNPDYFAAILFKRLMGDSVLSFQPTGFADGVRGYVHCTRPEAFSATSLLAESNSNGNGSITVLLLNSNNSTQSMVLDESIATIPRAEFVLTSNSEGGLSSSSVFLNNSPTPLAVGVDGSLPSMSPVWVESGGDSSLTLPPLSYGWFVLTQAGVSSCYQ